MNLRLFVFLMFLSLNGCGGSSSSVSSDTNTRFKVSVNPLSDPQNYYPYLVNKLGECIVPNSVKNSCLDSNTNNVSQLKFGDGFWGSSFGLAGLNNLQIELDPDVNETISIYSGATGTYSSKHSPIAVEHGHYTYFSYSGPAKLDGANTVLSTSRSGGETSNADLFRRPVDNKSNALGIYVARYNHLTAKVSAPVLVHVKHTDDPHDNAVLNFDHSGNLFILISGRTQSRSALLYLIETPNSTKVFDSNNLQLKNITPENVKYSTLADTKVAAPDFAGITYPKLIQIEGGFRLIFTLYCSKGVKNICNQTRQLWSAKIVYNPNLSDIAKLEEIKQLSAFGGHYAIAKGTDDGRNIVVAFNVLVNSEPGKRTNLYAMSSNDFGSTWRILNSTNIIGQSIEGLLPLITESALDMVSVYKVHGYTSDIKHRLYLKDISIESENEQLNVNILFVGERGVSESRSPLISDSHYLGFASLNTSGWSISEVTRQVDHNYSSGFIYAGDSDSPRLFFPATPEPLNNGLAGGALAFIDVKTDANKVNYSHSLSVPGHAGYLSDLCEMNYFRPVANQGYSGFVGIGGASNPYQFTADSSNDMLSASPLFFTDSNGQLFRLPMSLLGMDENKELEVERLIKGQVLRCDSSL